MIITPLTFDLQSMNHITTIYVRFQVKADKQKEFEAELSQLLKGLEQEKTFIEARIHRDLDEPNVIVLYESYSESRESFLNRVPNKPWFKAFLDNLPNLLEKERQVLWHERLKAFDTTKFHLKSA